MDPKLEELSGKFSNFALPFEWSLWIKSGLVEAGPKSTRYIFFDRNFKGIKPVVNFIEARLKLDRGPVDKIQVGCDRLAGFEF